MSVTLLIFYFFVDLNSDRIDGRNEVNELIGLEASFWSVFFNALS